MADDDNYYNYSDDDFTSPAAYEGEVEGNQYENVGYETQFSTDAFDIDKFLLDLGVPAGIIENITPPKSGYEEVGQPSTSSSGGPKDDPWDFSKLFDPKYFPLFTMLGTGINGALGDKRKEEAAEKLFNAKNSLDSSIYSRNRADTLIDKEALRQQQLADTTSNNAFLAEQNRLNRENSLAIANLRNSTNNDKPAFQSIGSYTRTPGK